MIIYSLEVLSRPSNEYSLGWSMSRIPISYQWAKAKVGLWISWVNVNTSSLKGIENCSCVRYDLKYHTKQTKTIPSLKLTWHLNMDGWNTTVGSFWDGLFSGAMLVSGSVVLSTIHLYHFFGSVLTNPTWKIIWFSFNAFWEHFSRGVL